MNIAIHSRSGDGLALGLRLQDEGHAVGLYLEKERAQQIGRGLIYQIEDFPAAAERADLVLFDQVGAGSLADLLREKGLSVLGASKWTDTIELDRIAGLRTFAAAGLAVPPWEPFEDASFERAKRYVEAHAGTRYVFKPCGNIATDKTYVAHDTDDLLAYLEHMEKTIEGEEGRRPPFLLQEFVDGIEVSVERWYSQGRPVEALTNCTFEEKKFLVGNLGPAVGCAGNVVMPLRDRRLLSMTTARLDRLAAAHKITGPIDLNNIIAARDHRAYTIEATSRFGYDAMQAFLDLWPRPLAPYIVELARGGDTRMRLSAPASAAVRVSIPPYPSGEAKEAAGTPILEDVLTDPRVWVGDVMLDADDRLVCTGADAIVYVVTGQGRDALSAFAACYDWLRQVRTGDAQWRTDLAERTAARIRQLRAWNFIPETGRLAA